MFYSVSSEHSRRCAPKAGELGSRWMDPIDDKKRRIFVPPEGTRVTQQGNIVCITNAGKRFWESGQRQQEKHRI